MSMNIFEFATRNKLRFASSRGLLTVEQLWDVPLRSSDDFNLNAVARLASKACKDVAEDNFVETAKTPEHARLEATLEVVKYVIESKLGEETAAKKRAENKLQKDKLVQILAEKQDGKLAALPEKELLRRINALDE